MLEKKFTLKITSSDVKSGDIFLITRFDGLDPIINVGAGSRAGHSTIILKDDDG